MSINKLALLRYNTIDKCLRNRRRKWTLEDLITKISEVLYEQEGIENGIGKRTIQADIQTMRSDKLGYNAPIIVVDKKYYTYEQPDFSIHQVPISDQDMQKMKDVVSLMKQLSGFNHLASMNDIILRLEHILKSSESKEKTFIQLEQNHLVKGLEWIPLITKYIQEEIPILLTYKSFKAKTSQQTVFYPYLLKEHRKRWFIIGKTKGRTNLETRALDRIIDIQEMAPKDFIPYEGMDFDRYYAECIGVTRSENERPFKVIFKVDHANANYIKTKPFHHTQHVVEEISDGIIFRMDVIINFELQKELLGMGEALQVMAPKNLVNILRARTHKMSKLYAKKEKTKD